MLSLTDPISPTHSPSLHYSLTHTPYYSDIYLLTHSLMPSLSLLFTFTHSLAHTHSYSLSPQREVIPEASKWNLGSLTFDDFSLSQDQMVLAAVRMFSDLRLTSRFKIEYKVSLGCVNEA